MLKNEISSPGCCWDSGGTTSVPDVVDDNARVTELTVELLLLMPPLRPTPIPTEDGEIIGEIMDVIPGTLDIDPGVDFA